MEVFFVFFSLMVFLKKRRKRTKYVVSVITSDVRTNYKQKVKLYTFSFWAIFTKLVKLLFFLKKKSLTIFGIICIHYYFGGKTKPWFYHHHCMLSLVSIYRRV